MRYRYGKANNMRYRYGKANNMRYRYGKANNMRYRYGKAHNIRYLKKKRIIMPTGPLPKMSGPEMKCYINSMVSLPLPRVKGGKLSNLEHGQSDGGVHRCRRHRRCSCPGAGSLGRTAAIPRVSAVDGLAGPSHCRCGDCSLGLDGGRWCPCHGLVGPEGTSPSAWGN